METHRAFEVGQRDRQVFVNEGKTTQGVVGGVNSTLQEKFFKIRLSPGVGFGVLLTPEAPENLRKLAYNFNFNCLSKIGGCKEYEEMLPILGRKDLVGPHPDLH
jgi:hypothetical protein